MTTWKDEAGRAREGDGCGGVISRAAAAGGGLELGALILMVEFWLWEWLLVECCGVGRDRGLDGDLDGGG